MDSRAERRALERKTNRLSKWLLSLTKEQKEFLTEYCNDYARADLYAFGYAWEMVLRPKIYEKSLNELLGEHELNNIMDLVEEEGKRFFEYKKNGGDYIMAIKGSVEKIIKKYEELKNKGLKEKEVHEELVILFPNLSSTAIKNTIAEYKRDLRNKKLETKEDQEVNAALKSIFPEEDKKPAVINPEFEKAVKDMENQKEEPKEDIKVDKEIVFEELSKSIIADVKGSLGVYHIENGKADIEGFTFATDKDVEEELALRKKVIENLTAELEVREKEYKAIIKAYIA